MAMRSVISRGGLFGLMEGNWRSSASSLRYFSDGSGRVLSEEERAKETVFIQVFFLGIFVSLFKLDYAVFWVR